MCVKVPQDYTYRANPSRTIFSKLPWLFHCIFSFGLYLKNVFGFLKCEVVCYACGIALVLPEGVVTSLPLNLEGKSARIFCCGQR